MVRKDRMTSREEWLAKRTSYIGGSDASSILGLNPYKTNIVLWKEKCGLKEPKDISNEPVVKYGVACEPLIRELFKIDHPDMRVEYEEWNIFLNTAYPWAHASLDGWMFDELGRFGVLEIKTTHIQGTNILKWKDRIPDNYYVQLLHYLMVTEAEFAILRALLKYEGNFKRSEIRDYKVERKDVVADIEYLQREEEKFMEHIRNRTQPNLILPEI